MLKFLLIFSSAVIITTTCRAQKSADSLIYNLPMENGKLIYAGKIMARGLKKATLDSAAVKWFRGYFKYYRPYPTTTAPDSNSAVYDEAIFEYKINPGMVYIPFYAKVTFKIKCSDDGYEYKISDIYFRPQNGVLNAIGYQRDPSYLINLYKKKHFGFFTSMSIDRSMIRKYISATDGAITNCITSLKAAMPQ